MRKGSRRPDCASTKFESVILSSQSHAKDTDHTQRLPQFESTSDAPPTSPSASSCSSQHSCCHDSDCNLSTNTPVPRSAACSWEACLNPEICDKIECCDDEACIHPNATRLQVESSACNGSEITEEERDDFAEFINYDTTESGGSMPCRWLETDQQCSVTAPPAVLSQHVFKDHIEQSTWLPCEWAQCDQTIESQQLLQHVVQEHRLDQYVCLWQGCGYSFSSDNELATHMAAMHCSKLDCHWGGCEFNNMDRTTLKSHVTDEHLKLNTTEAFLSHSYGSGLPATSPMAAQPQISQTSSSPAFSTPPSRHNSFEEIPSIHPIQTSNPKKHQCLWTVDESAHAVCAACFTHENQLQAHVEKAHLSSLSARKHPLGSAGLVCRWQGCKANGSSHNGKDKLRKHTYTHTGCKSTRTGHLIA